MPLRLALLSCKLVLGQQHGPRWQPKSHASAQPAIVSEAWISTQTIRTTDPDMAPGYNSTLGITIAPGCYAGYSDLQGHSSHRTFRHHMASVSTYTLDISMAFGGNRDH